MTYLYLSEVAVMVTMLIKNPFFDKLLREKLVLIGKNRDI